MARGAIQFATSDVGSVIAYTEMGTGPPLIVIHNFTASHVDLDWHVESFRSFYETLAERHQVIRLDPRGTGLSTVEPHPTVEQVAADVTAVARALGHTRFDLLAVSTMAAVGIRLAAAGNVGRLMLCDPSVTMAEAKEQRRFIRAIEALAEVELGDLLYSFWAAVAPPDDMHALQAVTEANVAAHPGVMSIVEWDGRPWLEAVGSPTLIIYTRDGLLTSVEQAREAAAKIPDARLIGVEGRFSPYFSDREAVLEVLGEFLCWQVTGERSTSDTSIIVFTDIVASTETIDRAGDTSARAAIRSVEKMVESLAAEFTGRVVKHLGDGSLLEFGSASNALGFAQQVQLRMTDRNLELRVGMAAGEPIHEDGDLHGAVVVVASRVTDEAGSGEVLTSDGVRQLVSGKPYEFVDRGECRLKGFDDPVRVWRLVV